MPKPGDRVVRLCRLWGRWRVPKKGEKKMGDYKYHYTSIQLEPYDRCNIDGGPCPFSRLINGQCQDYEPREETDNAEES